MAPSASRARHDLEIANAALDRFDLLHLARRHVQELSGGERKRVFLARALAQEAKIALLDEPTAFLDLKHVAEIFARFRELSAERGMTVIATLHDLNAAALYADRVLLLSNGAAVAYGTPAEVLTAAKSRARLRNRRIRRAQSFNRGLDDSTGWYFRRARINFDGSIARFAACATLEFDVFFFSN